MRRGATTASRQSSAEAPDQTPRERITKPARPRTRLVGGIGPPRAVRPEAPSAHPRPRGMPAWSSQPEPLCGAAASHRGQPMASPNMHEHGPAPRGVDITRRSHGLQGGRRTLDRGRQARALDHRLRQNPGPAALPSCAGRRRSVRARRPSRRGQRFRALAAGGTGAGPHPICRAPPAARARFGEIEALPSCIEDAHAPVVAPNGAGGAQFHVGRRDRLHKAARSDSKAGTGRHPAIMRDARSGGRLDAPFPAEDALFPLEEERGTRCPPTPDRALSAARGSARPPAADFLRRST
jgi:hypothetical protein